MNDHDEWRIDEAFANMTDPEAREALRELAAKLERWRHDPSVSVRRYAALATGFPWQEVVDALAATPAPDTGVEERLPRNQYDRAYLDGMAAERSHSGGAEERLRAALPDVDAMRAALHRAGIGCKPNVVYCRATHRGHAERILSALSGGSIDEEAPRA